MYDLLELSAQFGIKPSEFWDMTYIDLVTYVKGQHAKLKSETISEMQKIISQAWYGVYYDKCFKKLPSLKDELENLSENMEENTDEKLFKKLQKMGGGK